MISALWLIPIIFSHVAVFYVGKMYGNLEAIHEKDNDSF